MPANPAFIPITISVPANESYKLRLAPYFNEVCKFYGAYESTPRKNNNGIHIKSTTLITCYYENGNSFNCDIYSLKGKNALGTDFYTSFQTTLYNMTNTGWAEQATNGFIVVATEDNTQVTIASSIPIYGHVGEPSLTINLDRGEVYLAVPNRTTVPPNGNALPPDWSVRAGVDHLAGTHVTTNGKNVAITLYDDSMKSLVDACYDDAGDQTIPTTIIGNEYIALRGQLCRSNPSIKVGTAYQSSGINQNDTIQERLYILGTADNDSVFINGIFYSTMSASQTVLYKIPNNIPYVHIRSKFNCYVWQITGFGCEMGNAILPPINKCTGSLDVGFTRSSSDGFYLNIIVRRGAESGFLLNGIPTAVIDLSSFVPVLGDSNWRIARLGPFSTSQILLNKAYLLSNTINTFHLGIINGSRNTGSRFGYFSDFNASDVVAFNTSNGLRSYSGTKGDQIQLVINGGNNITWFPSTYLDNPNIATPIATPFENITYTVTSGNWCGISDTSSIQIEVIDPSKIEFIKDSSNDVFVKVNPNPFSNTVDICYTLPTESKTQIRIFVANGELAYSSGLVNKATGTYCENINTNSFKSGSYIIQLLANEKVYYVKAIK